MIEWFSRVESGICGRDKTVHVDGSDEPILSFWKNSSDHETGLFSSGWIFPSTNVAMIYFEFQNLEQMYISNESILVSQLQKDNPMKMMPI